MRKHQAQKPQTTGLGISGQNGCLLWLALILAVGFGAISFLLVAIQGQFAKSETKLARITELVQYDYPTQVSYPIASTPRARRPIELTDANASPIQLVNMSKQYDDVCPDCAETKPFLASVPASKSELSDGIKADIKRIVTRVEMDKLTAAYSSEQEQRLDAIESRLDSLEQSRFKPFASSTYSAPISPPITYSVEPPRMPVQSFSGGSTGGFKTSSVSSWAPVQMPSVFSVSKPLTYSQQVSMASNGGFSSPSFSKPVVSQPRTVFSQPRKRRAMPIRSAFSAARQAVTINRNDCPGGT